jgi:hypothetical protein
MVGASFHLEENQLLKKDERERLFLPNPQLVSHTPMHMHDYLNIGNRVLCITGMLTEFALTY